MAFLSDNLRLIVGVFKGRGENFSVSIRDIAGWGAVIGLGLSVAAWKLSWVSNLVTVILGILFIGGVVCGLLAYPVSQILFRNENKPYYYAWAEFKKDNNQVG